MITIRTAHSDDIPHILKLAEDTISPAWTHLALSDALRREDTVLLIAVSDKGHIAGFSSFREVGDDGELLQIAVAHEHRRSGIGSKLLTEVVGIASDKGLHSVFLEVRTGNTGAVKLYRKHGFKQVRIRKNYYSNPDEDAVVMAREVAL